MFTDHDPYTCDCGGQLDHPGADCPACGLEAPDYTPQEDGPDAADLWEAHQAPPAPTVPELVIGLVGAAMLALGPIGLFLDARQVDAAIIAWKAEAWAWLLGAM